jgi:DNA-binding protein H-NS
MSTIAALKKKTNQIGLDIAKMQEQAQGINTEISNAARQKQFAIAISLQKKYEQIMKKVDLLYLQEQNLYSAKAELIVQMGNELGVMVEVKTIKTKKNQSVCQRKKAPVKFRHHATGESWTGRGLTPRWLVAAIAAGATKEDFAV